VWVVVTLGKCELKCGSMLWRCNRLVEKVQAYPKENMLIQMIYFKEKFNVEGS
jgi:hypothetical protein